MNNPGEGPLRARVVDWDRPLDDAGIAARLDALQNVEVPDDVRRREVLETLDVLAEELVGRTEPAAARLKGRITSLRRNLAGST